VIGTAAVVACLLLLGLIVLQAGLAAGRPWGRYAWGGQHEVLPQQLRISSGVSIAVYLFFAAVALTASGWARLLPEGFANGAAWVIAVYTGLGVLLNGISRSKPERAVMTPVTLVLAVCFVVIALG
jgi:preprotein translocase subunit SecG